MTERKATIRCAGDGALLIEVGEATPATGAFARALAARIRSEAWPGLRDVVPAYRTVLVSFDPCHPAADGYADRISALFEQEMPEQQVVGRVVEIPVRYGGVYGPDLLEVAAHTGMTAEEVVRMHASVLYTVEFLGFSPGFPYLSGLPAPLATPRLATPRLRVPAGTIGIGGAQTGIYPLESPGGWRLIGHTTALHFDPARPETLPYAPGDRIRFVPIDTEDPGVASTGAVLSAEVDHQDTRYGLRVLRAGPLTTVQDRGRFGWASLGYGSAGAMDAEAMSVGNRLLGNDPGAAVLELTLDGGEFEILDDLVMAITGADLGATIDDDPLPLWHACAARAGARLAFTQRRHGLRAYLAVAGGIRAEPILGSRATDLVSGIGGIGGRMLRAGDLIPITPSPPHACLQVLGAAQPGYPDEVLVRAVLGPQDHWFKDESVEQFAHAVFVVGARSDRTGIRLEGPPLHAAVHGDLLSEGQACGAIQVPPDGMPIVLTADGRGVGGYPKIAVVISADLALLGQAAPGTRVQFQPISAAEARTAARARRQWVAQLPTLPASEPGTRCLLEARQYPPGRWRCPRSLACLVSRRCVAPALDAASAPATAGES